MKLYAHQQALLDFVRTGRKLEILPQTGKTLMMPDREYPGMAGQPVKPRIRRYYGGKLGVLKWRCASTEAGNWGPYTREGVGYTPAEAYQHWARYGHHGRRPWVR